MPGRASIVGAAATHVGKVREHNEDAHFFDVDAGLFVVCDGMGGHAAGEVASALAIRTVRGHWQSIGTQKLVDLWLAKGSPDAKKQVLDSLRSGVRSAHDAILAEAAADAAKSGMGTTIVGGIVIGNELVFAHAGDSRAYLVRDGIAMQLTEDHTLLARLLAAGIDVDVSGEGARFRSMLTNALGIGQDCKVSTFVVPLADGDRFLLCSDGISEYVSEPEVGTVLTSQPSPARAAQKLVELALDRGGGDNATAIVIRVLEAGETPQPAEERRREAAVIARAALWGDKVSAQQRLRALRIAIAREVGPDERLPAHTMGDRVAWIVIDGEVEIDGAMQGPGAFLYPESLVSDGPVREKDALGITRSDVRALAFRADDFRELCDEDNELGEVLLETLGPLVAMRRDRLTRVTTPAPAQLAPWVTPAAPFPLDARRPAAAAVKPPPLRDAAEAISAGMEDALRAVTDLGGATDDAVAPSAPQAGDRVSDTSDSFESFEIAPAVENSPAPAPLPADPPKPPRPSTVIAPGGPPVATAKPSIAPMLPPKIPTLPAMRRTPLGVPIVPRIPAGPGALPPLPKPATLSRRDPAVAAPIPPSPTPTPVPSSDDEDLEEMTVSHESEDGAVVTARMTDSEAHTLVMTVTEPIDDAVTRPVIATRVPSARTSDIMRAVSGTISVPERADRVAGVKDAEDMSIAGVPVPSSRRRGSESDAHMELDMEVDDDRPEPDPAGSAPAGRTKRVSDGWE